MAPITNHVSLTISRDSLGIPRAGFGVPLILSHNATFPERTRSYDDLAGVAVDFAVTTSPEYLAAQAIFSQQPHPEEIKIGKALLQPTQRYAIAVANVRNSHAYTVAVAGDGVTAETTSFTSDAGATAQEIAVGLLADLNAVVNKNFTATYALLGAYTSAFTTTHGAETLQITAHGLQTGAGPFQLTNAGGALPAGFSVLTDHYWIRVDDDNGQLATSLALALAGTAQAISGNGTGTHTITAVAGALNPYAGVVVTGTAAGEWFSLEVNPSDLTIEQNHADPGVATDLAAILLEDPEWYCLLTHYNSQLYVEAAVAWVESNSKIYVFDANDTDFISAADNDDTLDNLDDNSRARSMGGYHPSPVDFMSAAWAGRVLPLEPGSETWKFKTLSGVSPVSLTSTQRGYLTGKNGNSYETVAGVNITFEGTTGDGDFLDVQRGLDWLYDDMSKSVFEAMARYDKVPFTEAGKAVIINEVKGSLRRAVQKDILAEDPAPVVTAPRIEDVSDSDKALRRLPDVKFSGTLAGAIHKVVITGVVSV